jgi:diaminohydroxyphosphoribosylaminopyrimidine deaminase/5-amino-6-(5-phosphoribosylamino)uracil reductase
MQYCLKLAQKAYPSPNPRVGSVIIQAHERVGSGYHPGAGHPHAEVFALREAGEKAVGGTLYVNLEPCNHYGRTPPCTEAIIAAGIQRVVAGMADPNPLVAGQGLERLRAAGIEVTVGIEEPACRRLNEAFCFAIQKKRSFGILKYAMSVDGKIATHTGESQWISESRSREWVHHLRAQVDAVVVGSGTVRRDNPQLTARLVLSSRQPLRVVLSRTLHLPQHANLWDLTQAKTIVLTEETCDPLMRVFLESRHIEVIAFAKLTPQEVSTFLYRRGCLSLLWECGGELAAAALADGSIQKLYAFIAPKIIGGTTAPSPIQGSGVEKVSQAWLLDHTQVFQIGSDYCLEAYTIPK